jgi:hypothetical protein
MQRIPAIPLMIASSRLIKIPRTVDSIPFIVGGLLGHNF